MLPVSPLRLTSCKNSSTVQLVWRRVWQPTPTVLSEEPHGQRAWWATVNRVAQSRTRLKRLSTHTVCYSIPPLSPLREHNVHTNLAIPSEGVTSFVLTMFPSTLLELYRGNHLSLQRRKWQPTPVFLPRESQGWGSLVGSRLWGRTESDTTEAI